MSRRSISKSDIQACARTARSCRYQAHAGTYRIDGEDLDGDTMTVVCGVDKDLIIVTVF